MPHAYVVKPLLVVKVGSTLPAIRERRGDFERWIAERLGETPDVLDVRDGAPLPDARAVRGVIVTGSTAMVTDREPWSERTRAWLPSLVDAGTPLLGICYGHQLLADALDGEVTDNPRGREIGTIDVTLSEAGTRDALFATHPPRFRVNATHVQSVVRLPRGARLLATSAGDPHQAFAVGPRAWGVQFHPEFDADVMRGYLEGRREALEREGRDVPALLAAAEDAPQGAALLARFAELLRAVT